MSVYTFIISSGGSIGLLAGGVLTQSVSWHWIFFINVPIGAVTFMLGRVLINETDRIGLGHGVDVIGSLLVTVALMLGVYAIVKATEYGWLSAHTLGFGAAALALLAVFVAVESRLSNPMFPLRILRVPGLAASSVVRGFLVTGMFSTFLLGVLYLQEVHGYGALRTGLAFLPLTLVLGVMSVGITARLMERFGATWVLLAGLTAITAALVLLSRLPAHTSYLPAIFAPFALLGLGAGMSFLPLTMIAMAEVPSADAGLASGIVNASLQISAAIGIAALGTVAAERTKVLTGLGAHHLQALTGGFHLAWVIGAGAVAAGALVTLVWLRPRSRPDEVIQLDEREAPEFRLEAA
jgi:MFS family permease